MINTLQLANFKAFGDRPQTIPLKPLTFILGPNSSGKSTILHSLLFAHHAARTGDLDVVYPELANETVDLGGFRQFIHGAQRGLESRLSWGADCSARDLAVHLDARRSELNRQLGGPESKDWSALLGDVTGLEIVLSIGIPRDDKGKPLPAARPRVERMQCLADQKLILSGFSTDENNLQIDQVASDHPIIKGITYNLVAAETFALDLSDAMRERITNEIDSLVANLQIKTDGFLPKKLYDVRARRRTAFEGETLRPETGSVERVANAIRLSLPRMLDELVVGIADLIRRDLFATKYLGPLRSYPPRHIAFSEAKDLGSEAGGGQAWRMLVKDQDVREKVNAWLEDKGRLKTPYQIKLRKYYTADEFEPYLEKSIRDAVLSVIENAHEDLDEQWLADLKEADQERARAHEDFFEKGTITEEEMIARAAPAYRMIDEWLESHANIDLSVACTQLIMQNRAESSTADLILVDKRSNTEVSHRDVGIGISQVLPVLVNAYGSRHQILAIEQPEIHLHPALQSELADVFIESALGENGNRCILETHSEHLLLRLMKRMRQTFENTLPEGSPPVRPEDVMILYVEPDGRQSIVRPMPLNARGELVLAWPGGFFEEGLREVF